MIAWPGLADVHDDKFSDSPDGISSAFLFGKLDQYIHHLIKCTKMLDYAWTNCDCSAPIVGKVLSTVIALLYNLLSTSFQSNTVSDLYDTKNWKLRE
jgi:hypothetical protein